MLELLLCSLLTILPDYLYRRYVQGKRIGKEITLYSVWFELRWGITGCLILTVSLITVIFYNHPSTTNATLFFRTVPILPETNGRVAEIYVGDERTGRQGRADLQAGQLEARGRGGNRPPQDRRVEAAMVGGASRHPEGRRPDPGGRGHISSRPSTNWRPSRSCTPAQPGNVPLREIEKAPGPCWNDAGARSRRPPPPNRPPSFASRTCCPPKRPAPKQR